MELPLLCGENTDGGGGRCGTVTINGSFNCSSIDHEKHLPSDDMLV